MYIQKYNIFHIKNAIALYDKYRSVRKVSFITNISKSTINRWWNKFHALSITTKFQKKKKQYKKYRKPKYLQLDSIIKNEFYQTNQLKYFSLYQLQQMLSYKYNITPSLSWIRIYLKKNKIKKKKFRQNKVCTKTHEQIKQMINQFRNEKHKLSNNNIICIDETSFCNINISNEGYYPIKMQPDQYLVRNKINLSMLMAISNKNILHYKIQNKPYNTISFMEFISELLHFIKKEKYVFIMDNVSFHKSKHVNDIIKQNGHEILFIPPYTPQCNPIEQVFSEIKRIYRSIIDTNIKNKIMNAINLINKNNIEKYYYCTDQFIKQII